MKETNQTLLFYFIKDFTTWRHCFSGPDKFNPYFVAKEFIVEVSIEIEFQLP